MQPLEKPTMTEDTAGERRDANESDEACYRHPALLAGGVDVRLDTPPGAQYRPSVEGQVDRGGHDEDEAPGSGSGALQEHTRRGRWDEH